MARKVELAALMALLALASCAAQATPKPAAAAKPAAGPKAAPPKPAAPMVPGPRRPPPVLKALSADGVAANSSLKALIDNGLTSFVLLANASGLAAPLNATAARITIFAPTNEAIARLAKEMGATMQQLLARQILVDRIAGMHIVPGLSLTSAKVKSGPLAMARGGVLVDAGKSGVVLKGPHNSAKVVKADIRAGNSTIHIIDNVLLPDDVFTTIKAALSYSNASKPLLGLLQKDPALAKAIADPKTNITLLVPTDKSLAESSASGALKAALSSPAMASKLLSYHAVRGARIFPNAVKAVDSLPTLDQGHSIALKKVVQGGIGHIELTADSKGSKPAKVVKYNIIAGDSMIQLIQGTLVPAM